MPSTPSPSPTAARRLEPHNRVAGKYRLRRRIAVGGMGEIWVAKNESTNADVAVKVLRADADPSLHAADRFRHEARLGAMLSHRSIVRIFDLIEEADGTLVLVMELLRGETLQTYLERNGPRPPKEAVAIVAPILSALQHAHEHGVVHRDVTPSNIFLAIDPDGQVTPKLVDFGIARAEGQPVQTLDGRVLGTPRYMSPEQIRSGASDKLDGKSDIFSVGVVLYEILTGASPFAASSAAASLAAVLETTVDPDPRIDPKIWVEIQRALSKRPYERHANALELASMLRAAIGETEGALNAALRRTRPPPTVEDEVLPPTQPPNQTRSIEGQSVALVIPGKRSSWPWLAGGVAIGLAGFTLAMAMRSPPRPAPAALAPAPPPTAAAPTTPPPALPTATPSVAATAPASAPTATTTTAATTTSATATAPPPRPIPRPTPPPRAKPVATTPGF